jgi:hypothetical protein
VIVVEAQDPARQHQVCVNAHATGPIATAAGEGRAVSKCEKVQAELAQAMQAHDAQFMQERKKASQAASCIEVVLTSPVSSFLFFRTHTVCGCTTRANARCD